MSETDIKHIHADIETLKNDLAIIKHILSEEGRLTKEARQRLEDEKKKQTGPVLETGVKVSVIKAKEPARQVLVQPLPEGVSGPSKPISGPVNPTQIKTTTDPFLAARSGMTYVTKPEEPKTLATMSGLEITSNLLAKTGVTALSFATGLSNFLVHLAENNTGDIIRMTNPSFGSAIDSVQKGLQAYKLDKKAVDAWKSVIGATSGKLNGEALYAVKQLEEAVYIQPTEEYQNSTTLEKITKYLPETLFHQGPSVAASFALLATGAPGAVILGGSIADEIEGYAEEAGWDAKSRTVLALGTAIPVMMLDKFSFGKLFEKSNIKETFLRGLVTRVFGKIFSEGGTEVTQEVIQLAAEATVREDLTLSEAEERIAISGVLGALSGGSVGIVQDVFNGVISNTRRQTQDKPIEIKTKDSLAVDQTVSPDEVLARQEAISKLFSIEEIDRSEFEQKKNVDIGKFHQGIDKTTFENLNVGDVTTPISGSVFEFENKIFITRDTGQTNEVIGYTMPLDGTTAITLETVSLDKLTTIAVDINTIKQALQNSGVETDVRRSEQFIDNEGAIEVIRRYFTAEELPVSFVEKINTPDGASAFGRYTKGIVEFINNPHETTPNHEAVHAYLDLFYNDSKRRSVLDSAREQSGFSKMSDSAAEEWVANRFAEYVRDRTGVIGSVRDFFDYVTNKLRRLFRQTNSDNIDQLFQDIRTGKRPTQNKTLLDFTRKQGQTMKAEDVQKSVEDYVNRLNLSNLEIQIANTIITESGHAFAASFGNTLTFIESVPRYTSDHEMVHVVMRNLNNFYLFRPETVSSEPNLAIS